MTARTLPHLALALALAAPGAAWAHGGEYRQPDGSPGPQVPPGLGDAPCAPTGWEAWWTGNRDPLLRIAQRRAKRDARVTTPGAAGVAGEDDDGVVLPPSVPRGVVDAGSFVAGMLGDADYDVRAAAAIACGKAEHRGAAAGLRSLAEGDKRDVVRRAALLGLGILGEDHHLPYLATVLADRAREVRERGAAAIAIGLVGGDAAARVLAAEVGRARGVPGDRAAEPPALAAALTGLGLTGSLEAVRPLWEVVDDAGIAPRERSFAVVALGRLEQHDSLERVQRLLRSGREACLRRAAAVATGRIARAGDSAVVVGLTSAAMGESDDLTRRYAVIALGRMGGSAAKDALDTLFETVRPADRPFVALAMSLATHRPAAPRIRRALAEETDGSARSSYCLSLALIDDRDGVPALEGVLRLPAEAGWVRGAAALGLGLLRHPASHDTIWEMARAEPDPRLRTQYAVALGLLGSERVVPWLATTLREGPTPSERAGAAATLGFLRAHEATQDLCQTARSATENGLVRALAVVALGQIADRSPVPKLSRLRIDDDPTLGSACVDEARSIL